MSLEWQCAQLKTYIFQGDVCRDVLLRSPCFRNRLVFTSRSVANWPPPFISSWWCSSSVHALLGAAPAKIKQDGSKRPGHFYRTQDSPNGQSWLWSCTLSGLYQAMMASFLAQCGSPLLSQVLLPIKHFALLSSSQQVLPEEHNQQHLDSFVTLGSHMAQFWPGRCK